MTAYLERYGGFCHCRDTGLIMWIVAHAMDAVAQDDFHATKEFLALLIASLAQSALDNGCVAFVLSLMEEPPQQLSAERMQPLSASERPFAPLVPPAWAAVALSCLKEIEVLTTRKVEMKKAPTPVPAKATAPSGATEEGAPASSKRKPGFPRKSKAGAGALAAACSCGSKRAVSDGGPLDSKIIRVKQNLMHVLDFLHDVKNVLAMFNLDLGAFTMSYPRWCAMVVPLILKNRTPFSAFVSRTIHLTRSFSSQGTSAPTLFPVPVLNAGQFYRMPSGFSSSKRKLGLSIFAELFMWSVWL